MFIVLPDLVGGGSGGANLRVQAPPDLNKTSTIVFHHPEQFRHADQQQLVWHEQVTVGKTGA